MKFLFLIFLIFVLFVFLFGFSILRTIARILFGTRSKQQPTSSGTYSKSDHKSTHTNQQQTKSSQQKKIFTPDEGEYIEYEEVKD